ncbi:glycoside hydrolase family 30 beta sandwich domain-containing protein [Flagellimonas maritima]|nr:glycoside hydrolase [Allomuricauda aurantiaca]
MLIVTGCSVDNDNEEVGFNQDVENNDAKFSTSLEASSSSVTINWNNEKQTIQGIGASDAWLSDDIENHNKRNEIINRFFRTDGNNIGLSILRQRIDPNVRPDSNTWLWSNPKFKANAWVANQAKNRGVNKIWASCWTAPAWMKTNNSKTDGGKLKTENFSDYAVFLSEYVKRMKNFENVDYYGISPQNEPGYKTWESMIWDYGKLKDFIADDLTWRMNAAGLGSTKIFYPEETRWGDIDNEKWKLTSSDIQNNVDIICGHSYGPISFEDYSNYGKPIWHTEYWIENLQEIDGAIKLGEYIHKYFVQANVETFHYWWMVTNHPSKLNGLIRLDGSTNYTIYKTFYALGQFSKFIKPGWKRISVSNASPYSNIYISAYKNNNNSKVTIVAVNNSSQSQDVDINFNGFNSSLTPYRTSGSENLDEKSSIPSTSSMIVALPKKSITTFTGSASESSPLPPTGVWLRLKNRESGKFAYLKSDDSNRLRGNGQGSGNAAYWMFLDAGNGYYKIKNQSTNGFAYSKNNDSFRIRGNGAGASDSAFWKPGIVNGNWFKLTNKENGANMRFLNSDNSRLRADNNSTNNSAQWVWELL